MSSNIFIAIIFFILGSIACHLYKRHIMRDLESAVIAWKFQAELSSERLATWRCLRPHIGDINNIEDDIKQSLGHNLEDLIITIDKEVEDIKEMFGI